jgi:hypothetical protein
VIGDVIPPLSNRNGPADITFTPDGTLYGWSEDTDDLVSINKSTGLGTVISDSGVGTFGSGIASNASGAIFGALQGDEGNLFTINRTTGAATPGPLLTGSGGQDESVPALAFDAAGTLFGVDLNTGPDAKPSKLMTINTVTGAITYRPQGTTLLDAIEFVDVYPRSITLTAKEKVKEGKKVKLSGNVSSPRGAECTQNQVVEVQRKKNGQFVPVTTTVTGGGGPYDEGGYSTKVKVEHKRKFRTVVDEPVVCADAISPTSTVKIKKKKD